jgi:NAD(P)H-dependent FMN reductase
MPRLGIVIASIREGRVGFPVAQWFIELARRHGRFDVDVIDLKAIALPLFAERHHPRLQKYENEKQKAWSALVAGTDAFVFVTPEYNYGPSPALLNALDYLYLEWHYKPAAFVSYGGVSGGIRAVQIAKQTLTTLKMVPIVEAVVIPFVTQAVDRETGLFKATEQHDKAATVMLDELLRWTDALAPLRGDPGSG